MAKPAKVRVLYRDKHLIVVHKPSGLLVYDDSKDKKAPTCADFVKKMVGEDYDVYPVHRLDRGTCGVMIFALNSKVASLLLRDFKQGKIHKTYWAVVFGKTPASGDVREPLAANKSKDKQPAHTKYRRLGFVAVPELETLGDTLDRQYLSWVECDPRTGRYHQIRRHFRHIEQPLVGDEEYSGHKRTAFAKDILKLNRIALSAVAVRFVHPVTRREFQIETNPDDKFEGFLKSVKWEKLG